MLAIFFHLPSFYFWYIKFREILIWHTVCAPVNTKIHPVPGNLTVGKYLWGKTLLLLKSKPLDFNLLGLKKLCSRWCFSRLSPLSKTQMDDWTHFTDHKKSLLPRTINSISIPPLMRQLWKWQWSIMSSSKFTSVDTYGLELHVQLWLRWWILTKSNSWAYVITPAFPWGFGKFWKFEGNSVKFQVNI